MDRKESDWIGSEDREEKDRIGGKKMIGYGKVSIGCYQKRPTLTLPQITPSSPKNIDFFLKNQKKSSSVFA